MTGPFLLAIVCPTYIFPLEDGRTTETCSGNLNKMVNNY
jgi:hypothetical protein